MILVCWLFDSQLFVFVWFICWSALRGMSLLLPIVAAVVAVSVEWVVAPHCSDPSLPSGGWVHMGNCCWVKAGTVVVLFLKVDFGVICWSCLYQQFYGPFLQLMPAAMFLHTPTTLRCCIFLCTIISFLSLKSSWQVLQVILPSSPCVWPLCLLPYSLNGLTVRTAVT